MPSVLAGHVRSAQDLLQRADHCERTNQPNLAELYRKNAIGQMLRARLKLMSA